jgi:hypothetical protein
MRGEYIQDPNSLHAEDFDIVTDVILFECASFDSCGNINYDEAKLETALTNIRNAVGNRDIHLTVNLLGPWGNTDSEVWEDQMEAQSDEHNKAFESGVLEENIIAVLDKYDFDGVHFDYEYPISTKAWYYYNNFLVSLDKKLGDYTLGVAGNAWNIKFTPAAIRAIDTFEAMIYDKPFISHLIAAIFGLVPNCAASVALTSFYTEGFITLGTMLSGLFSGAGIGLIVLFKMNKSLKTNLSIVAIIVGAGIVFGLLADLVSLEALL